MDELYCVFQDMSSAENALETIYSNLIQQVGDNTLLDVISGQTYVKDSLSAAEMQQFGVENRRFPLFGKNAITGVKSTVEGYTISWATAQETNQGKTVFLKPADTLLDGVSGYTVETYDPNWFSN